MKFSEPVLPVKWIKILCIAAALYAIIVTAYLFTETGESLGARDFHQFWYAGHFIRQDRDPYRAFFAREKLHLPIYYSGVTPEKIFLENIRLFFRLFDQPGVHLSRWVEFMSGNHLITFLPSLAMTALVFLPLWIWLRKYPARTEEAGQVRDFHVLTILFLWTLLVAYHRLYDTLILIFFVILIFKGLADPLLWELSSRGRKALLAFMAVTPLILILPARIVDLLLPFYYGKVSDGITTLLLVIMLAISMFLLWRYLQHMQRKTINKETETHDLPNDPYRNPRQRWAPDS